MQTTHTIKHSLRSCNNSFVACLHESFFYMSLRIVVNSFLQTLLDLKAEIVNKKGMIMNPNNIINVVKDISLVASKSGGTKRRRHLRALYSNQLPKQAQRVDKIPEDIYGFSTPGGDEMIVMPKNRYIEMLRSAEISSIKESVARGEEELIDIGFLDMLLNSDDSPIKLWRKKRGLTAKELAKAVSRTPVHISNIETGKKNGSIELYMDIAKVLNVDVDDILPRRPSKTK